MSLYTKDSVLINRLVQLFYYCIMITCGNRHLTIIFRLIDNIACNFCIIYNRL